VTPASCVSAGLLNLSCLAVMTHWRPEEAHRSWLLVLLGVWGFADGIWQAQTNSKKPLTIYPTFKLQS